MEPYSDATRVLADIHSELQPLLQRIASHRFVAALEEGRVPREALNTLAAQQYKIVTHGIKNIALLLARYGQHPSRARLQAFLQAEFEVHAAILEFARELGLDEAALEHAPTLLQAQMFSYFETFVCLWGTDAELIAAFHFDAKAWIANAGRVARALRERYGLSPQATRFFDMYAAYLPADEDTLPYIQAALERGEPLGDCPACSPDDAALQAGLERGATATRLCESVRLLLEAEWHFWEAMAQAAGV